MNLRQWKRQATSSLLIVILFFAISCTTTPVYNPSLPLAIIKPASTNEIRQFGNNININPYIEPYTLLRGKLFEFYILKIIINKRDTSKIDIDCDIYVDQNNRDAKAYSIKEFAALWDSISIYSEDTNPAGNEREHNIQRSCLPSFSFIESSGIHEYFIPIAGKFPMKRPIKILIRVSDANGEQYTYEDILQ